MELNCNELSAEAFLEAIRICQGFPTVKIALNFNPIANHVTQNHCLVLLEAPAGLISKLASSGFSLSLKSYGLVVYKL